LIEFCARRDIWIKELQEQAIDIHHEQRARGTVPIYGQALALGTLMEQMHLEVGTCLHHALGLIELTQ
jgi:hypothetical protein